MVEAKKIDYGDKYYHIRFRDPGRFIGCRIPEWASVIADSILPGAQVVTCFDRKGRWKVQSVQIPIDVSESKAIDAAEKIQDKIDREKEYAPLYKQQRIGQMIALGIHSEDIEEYEDMMELV